MRSCPAAARQSGTARPRPSVVELSAPGAADRQDPGARPAIGGRVPWLARPYSRSRDKAACNAALLRVVACSTLAQDRYVDRNNDVGMQRDLQLVFADLLERPVGHPHLRALDFVTLL